MPPTPTALGELTADQVRTNPFRLLGLPPGTSAAMVRRTAEHLAARHRLGAGTGPPGPFPPAAPVDADALRRAAHQLRDPGARLLAELLWFEPRDAEPAGTEGGGWWALDGSMPADRLEEVWRRLGGRSPVAARNLAVLALVRLADADGDRDGGTDTGRTDTGGDGTGTDTGTGTGGGSEEGTESGWWAEAPAWWGAWLADAGTPAAVRARARVLGAGPVASLDADGVRRALTRAFVRPYLELAVRATDRGEEVSGAVTRGLAAAGLHPAEVRSALDDVAERADRHIDAVVETTWVQVQADPSQAQQTGLRLLAELGPWLRLLRAADTPGAPLSDCSAQVQARAGQLADMLVACGANWVQPDDEPGVRTAHRLATHALALATDQAMADRISATVRGLAAALEAHGLGLPPGGEDARACVLCGRTAGDDLAWIPVPLTWPPSAPPPPAARIAVAGDVAPGAPIDGRLPRCTPCARRSREARWRLAALPRFLAVAFGVGLGGFGIGGGGVLLGVLGTAGVLVCVTQLVGAVRVRRLERAAVVGHLLVRELTGLGYRLRRDWQSLDLVRVGDPR